jgi:hypothetical protein
MNNITNNRKLKLTRKDMVEIERRINDFSECLPKAVEKLLPISIHGVLKKNISQNSKSNSPSKSGTYFNIEKEDQQNSNVQDANLQGDLFLGGKRERCHYDDNDSVKDSIKLKFNDLPNYVADDVKNQDFNEILDKIYNDGLKDSKKYYKDFVELLVQHGDSDYNHDQTLELKISNIKNGIPDIESIIINKSIISGYFACKVLFKYAKETLIKLGLIDIDVNTLINKIDYAISRLELRDDASYLKSFSKRLIDILVTAEKTPYQYLKSNCIHRLNKLFSIFYPEEIEDKNLKLNLIQTPIDSSIDISDNTLKNMIYSLDMVKFMYDNQTNKYVDSMDLVVHKFLSSFKMLGMLNCEIYYIIDNIKKVQLITNKMAFVSTSVDNKNHNLLSDQLISKLGYNFIQTDQDKIMYNQLRLKEIDVNFKQQKAKLQAYIHTMVKDIILIFFHNKKITATSGNVSDGSLQKELIFYIKREIKDLVAVAILSEKNTTGDDVLNMKSIPMMLFKIDELLLRLDKFKINTMSIGFEGLGTRLRNLKNILEYSDKTDKITDDVYIKYKDELSKINAAVKLYGKTPQIGEFDKIIYDALQKIDELTEAL